MKDYLTGGDLMIIRNAMLALGNNLAPTHGLTIKGELFSEDTALGRVEWNAKVKAYVFIPYTTAYDQYTPPAKPDPEGK